MSGKVVRARERVPTGRRGRPSKSMIAAAMERPFCAYLHKICLNNRLEGHKYCIDHIMNDKTAPYRQCTYVHAVTARRCTRAAHKVDRRASPLCHYHRALRLNTSSLPPISLEEANSDSRNLHEELAHHVEEAGQAEIESKNTFWTRKPDGSAVPSEKLTTTMSKYCVKNHYEDLSPVELPTMEEIAARHNNADSDTESVDNAMDVFKHAQVFTEEELTRTLRDKMIKLRRLYIEQYGHIQYILKEKRLKYIQAQRIEDETYGELFSYRNNPDSPDYSKLRAMLRYHKTFGPEALLQDQAIKRKQSRPPTVGPHTHPHHAHAHHDANQTKEGQESTTPTTSNAAAPNAATTTNASADTSTKTEKTVCIFSKTPHGCDRPCIPLSPYCRQHILYDPKQVLFRPCAGGIPPCLAPVVSFTRKNRCWLHIQQ